MKQINICDWAINENNVFKFDKKIYLGFFLITTTIYETIIESEGADEWEYWDLYIDITKILDTKLKISIDNIFSDLWVYDYSEDSKNLIHRMSIELICEIELDFLLRCCVNNENPLLYDHAHYTKLYEEKLQNFLQYSTAEVDDSDFIRSEIEKCIPLKKELGKAIYYLKYSRESRNFNNFATVLESRLDKRVAFLNVKLVEFSEKFVSHNSTVDPDNNQLSNSSVSARIRKHFGFFQYNCPRQHKKILNEFDAERLFEWTIYFFETNFQVPVIADPIKVVNTNKTFVQLAFKYLFKEIHPNLTYPDSLFELYISIFLPFSKDGKKNFGAVRSNNDVKKLMLIDY